MSSQATSAQSNWHQVLASPSDDRPAGSRPPNAKAKPNQPTRQNRTCADFAPCHNMCAKNRLLGISCTSIENCILRENSSRGPLSSSSSLFFPSRATRWRQGLLCARPRHAEHQPASDRGETAPPSAPARARSVNTYARPSAHGNIRASRAHSLTYSADHMPTPRAADDLVGRAERPPHTTRQALNHPQRAAAHRAALPAKPTLHSTANRRTTQYINQPTPARTQHRRRTRDSSTPSRTARARRTPPQRSTQSTLPISSSSTAQHSKQAHNTAHHPAHTSARAAHADARATPTHTRTARARRTPAQRHTCPHQQQQQACHSPHLTHARPHSPLPARVLFAAERNHRNRRVGLRP